MKLFESLEQLKEIKGPVHLALGVFDGVHIGHQQVIGSAVEAAKKSGGVAGVLTFFPHPIQVLAPDRAPKRILASLSSKAKLLETIGCDFLAVQKFDLDFASSRAKSFIETVVQHCHDLRSISVGEDWQFGKGREGNVKSLAEWGEELGFTLYAAAPVMSDGERISSTRIRQAIRDGNLVAIEKMIGRPYQVMGEVLRGRQLARTLGFPTANVKVFNEQLAPDGVWSVDVFANGEWHPAIGNLGRRPTVENDENAQRLLEVHLFDFSDDLYGKEVAVRFKKFVREEKKFDGIEALKAQIEADVAEVKASLK